MDLFIQTLGEVGICACSVIGVVEEKFNGSSFY